MQETISITISGKVQGVFFRKGTREKAISLGITGEVKNLTDGSVQIIATGTREHLEDLTRWCKTGPVKARVDGIEVTSIEFTPYNEFRISK